MSFTANGAPCELKLVVHATQIDDFQSVARPAVCFSSTDLSLKAHCATTPRRQSRGGGNGTPVTTLALTEGHSNGLLAVAVASEAEAENVTGGACGTEAQVVSAGPFRGAVDATGAAAGWLQRSGSGGYGGRSGGWSLWFIASNRRVQVCHVHTLVVNLQVLVRVTARVRAGKRVARLQLAARLALARVLDQGVDVEEASVPSCASRATQRILTDIRVETTIEGTSHLDDTLRPTVQCVG